MFYVVSIDKSRVGAAREAATAVPGTQCTPHRRWNGSRSAADGQRFTVFVLLDADDRAIAGNAPGRYRGNVGAVFDMGVVGVAKIVARRARSYTMEENLGSTPIIKTPGFNNCLISRGC